MSEYEPHDDTTQAEPAEYPADQGGDPFDLGQSLLGADQHYDNAEPGFAEPALGDHAETGYGTDGGYAPGEGSAEPGYAEPAAGAETEPSYAADGGDDTPTYTGGTASMGSLEQ
jgi:hypothetical protein